MSEIIKICKKHGELTIDNTYMQKNTRMCSICKRGYRNDWRKLNPLKVKAAQERKRNKHLNELANGTLVKNCKRHGIIPLEKIRVDVRGTLVCRLCDVENKKNLIAKDPVKYKKRVAIWLHSDPERKRRYRENDRPKRRIRQRNLYKKWKEIPEKRKRMLEQSEKSRKKLAANLADSYVKGRIKDFRMGGIKNQKRTYLKNVEIPAELIELKKLQIKFNRELRKQRKLKNGN